MDKTTILGEYNNHFKEGVYCCKACSSELFKSAISLNHPVVGHLLMMR